MKAGYRLGEMLPTADAIQFALSEIHGVMASRVVVQEGRIDEIHILAEARRPAKQIVRDVESLCAAKFGVKIDHRKVSVALLDAPPPQHVGAKRRPRVRGVRMETDGSQVDVHVTLEGGTMMCEGHSSGLFANRFRVAAAAVLMAMEEYLQGNCRLVLDDVLPFRIGGWDGYLVGIVMVSPFGEEQLVGSALVKHDPLDTVIRATCDALNRRIGVTSISSA